MSIWGATGVIFVATIIITIAERLTGVKRYIGGNWWKDGIHCMAYLSAGMAMLYFPNILFIIGSIIVLTVFDRRVLGIKWENYPPWGQFTHKLLWLTMGLVIMIL